MINILPLTIESMVSILLLLTILYCIRLNKQLKHLKADGSSMKRTIAELLAATDTAERAIAGLKATVRETEETLGERLRSAEKFSAEMRLNTEAGSEVLERLTRIAGVRLAEAGTKAEETQAPLNPRAIGAAAKALAERARARARAIAA